MDRSVPVPEDIDAAIARCADRLADRIADDLIREIVNEGDPTPIQRYGRAMYALVSRRHGMSGDGTTWLTYQRNPLLDQLPDPATLKAYAGPFLPRRL